MKTPACHRSKRFREQEGVVIIIALFIVALVAAMSYMMMARLARDTQRTSLLLRNAQAELYAQASVYWAVDQLKNNFSQQKPDQLIDQVPIKSPPNDQGGYHIESTIYDLQGRYNLNNLSTPQAQADFIRLIKAVQPKISIDDATDIAKAVTDWVTPNKNTSFDKYYEGLASPYRSAHHFMLSSTELTLVKGMTPQLYSALQPYITALPITTKINVMTADAPVLMTLAPTMTMEIAEAVIAARQATPIVSPDRLSKIDQIKNNNIDPSNIAVSSSYFLVVTTVAIEKQQLLLYTLLERTGSADKPIVTIILQSEGIW